MRRKAINAGDLSARIQFERDTITRQSGAEVRVPAVYDSAWAMPEALSGYELFRAQQVSAKTDWRFTVRYEWRDIVRTEDRILYRGRRYEVTAILPDEAGMDSVDLLCRTLNV